MRDCGADVVACSCRRGLDHFQHKGGVWLEADPHFWVRRLEAPQILNGVVGESSDLVEKLHESRKVGASDLSPCLKYPGSSSGYNLEVVHGLVEKRQVAEGAVVEVVECHTAKSAYHIVPSIHEASVSKKSDGSDGYIFSTGQLIYWADVSENHGIDNINHVYSGPRRLQQVHLIVQMEFAEEMVGLGPVDDKFQVLVSNMNGERVSLVLESLGCCEDSGNLTLIRERLAHLSDGTGVEVIHSLLGWSWAQWKNWRSAAGLCGLGGGGRSGSHQRLGCGDSRNWEHGGVVGGHRIILIIQRWMVDVMVVSILEWLLFHLRKLVSCIESDNVIFIGGVNNSCYVVLMVD